MGAIIQKIINYDIQFALSSIPINHPKIECQPIIDEDIVITYPKQFDNSPNFDFIYNNDIIKNFVFPAHNQDYNNLTKSKLITMNLNIHHSTYVDDAFITSIVKQRQNFAFVPVSMCRKLKLPYIPHSDLISHTSIYLSSLKNEKLNEVNLDMFKFIESYLKKNKAFYVINRNS
ncbi:LysR family transcriptional regulator [Staphylococcus equorum]|nr:LysR family transcriptional regulator [Staphylococcus equorum]MDK9864100.1 LysR family transcriptional regulator [Staphylococcus equorum]